MSMHLLTMTQTALNAGFTQAGLWTAVIVLACVFGAEIACISILISKMLRARKQKNETYDEDGFPTGQNRKGYAMLFLVGAIPQMAYTALGVLAVLVTVGAFVFALLLILFLSKGYDCAPLSFSRKEEEEHPARPLSEEASAPAFAETPAQRDDGALDVFAEAPVSEPIEEAEETEEDDPDEDQPIYADLTPRESEPVEEVLPAPVVMPPAAAEASPATLDAAKDPTFADGTRPYKVVEKIVTETYKEIIKETPVATAAPAATESRDANGAILEKLSDFLDYELQRRKAEDAQAEENADASEDTAKDPTLSAVALEELEDDADMDEDAEDEEESSEEGDGDAEERDEEENDTEGDHFTGNERIIGFDEETGCYIVAHYRKSFEAKLIQARPNIKKYYSEIKNALLSYKGTKDRVSWNMDSFHNGRTPIAKINVKTRILELYLALDPDSLEGTVYRGKNVGDKKKYVDTPFRYKLRTPRKFQWALELVQRTCEEHGLSPIDIEPVDYVELYPFDTTEHLVERKLIKEYIRQEKPATTFELSADHVPAVPEEDGSVIPANANFSWELDNERLPEKDPEPIAVEETPEEAPEEVLEQPVEAAPENEPPVEEAAPAPAPTVAKETVRETVKVTEMRYTERYYADPTPTFERVVTTEEPLIEAVAVSAEPESAPEEVISTATYTETEPAVVEPVIEETEITEEVEADEDLSAAEMLFSTADPFAAYRDAEEPAEEVYEDESVEEEPAEEVYEDESVEEEPAEEVYEDESVEEEPAEEVYEDESVEEEPAEEVYEDESVEEEPAEEVYEDELIEEEPAEEVRYTVKAMGFIEETPVEEAPANPPAEEGKPRIRIKTDPSVAIIDISSVQYDFSDGDTVNLATLRELGLVQNAAYRLKVYTTGPVEKALNVEADHLTLDAIKAISDANGTIAITQ